MQNIFQKTFLSYSAILETERAIRSTLDFSHPVRLLFFFASGGDDDDDDDDDDDNDDDDDDDDDDDLFIYS